MLLYIVSILIIAKCRDLRLGLEHILIGSGLIYKMRTYPSREIILSDSISNGMSFGF